MVSSVQPVYNDGGSSSKKKPTTTTTNASKTYSSNKYSGSRKNT